MGDLISREKVIDALWGLPGKFNAATLVRWDDVITALDGLAAEPQWTLCKEHQPEEAGLYLVTRRDGEVDVGRYDPWDGPLYNHDDWVLTFPWSFVRVGNEEIIAWMKRPDPCKEKAEEADEENTSEAETSEAETSEVEQVEITKDSMKIKLKPDPREETNKALGKIADELRQLNKYIRLGYFRK